VSAHREAFIQTLRAGAEMRNRAFLAIAQRHAADFADGAAGVRYYEDMLAVVRDAELPEAAEEFQRRFAPLLDPDGARARRAAAAAEASEEAPKPRRRFWPTRISWAWIALLGAALAAAAILWLDAVPAPPARPPAARSAPELVAPAAPEPTPELAPEPVTPSDDPPTPPPERTPE
jgi:hypothetical protein